MWNGDGAEQVQTTNCCFLKLLSALYNISEVNKPSLVILVVNHESYELACWRTTTCLALYEHHCVVLTSQ